MKMFLQITGIKRQVFITIILYMGQCLIGFYGAWAGPIMPKLRDPEQSPVPYKLTETELSLMASIVLLGCIPGPLATVWLSNTIGRKPCIVAGGVLYTIGSAILAAANDLAMLYSGRLMVGLGGGVVCVMNMVYIGEIASTNIRGILLTGLGLSMTVGSLLLFSIGPFLSYFLTTAVGLVLAIAFTLGTLIVPESPTFYVIKGNDKKAAEVLRDFGRLKDIEGVLAAKEDITTKTSDKQDWKELFSVRSNRKALLIVLVTNVLQNSSGFWAVMFYSTSIFEMAGSSINSDISIIVIVAFQLLGSCITPLFIERTGRKKIMIISCAICCISMVILGLYFYLNYLNSPVIDKINWLPLLALVIYFVSYNFGYGIIPNTLIGEMFTPNVRSKGSTLTMGVSWLAGFAVTFAFGVLLKSIGGHTAFWFFSLVCAAALAFTELFVPETKGKTLAEIQDLLSA